MKRKKKGTQSKKELVVPFDVFGCSVFVRVISRERLQEENPEKEGVDAYTTCYPCGCSRITLNPSVKISTLVHECYHAVHHLFQSRGVDVGLDTETIAYHLGYLTDKVFEYAILGMS